MIFFVIWNCLGHQIWLRWVTNLSFERNIQEIRHMNWREIRRRPKHDHRQLGLAWAKGGTPPDSAENRLHNFRQLHQILYIFTLGTDSCNTTNWRTICKNKAFPFPGTPYCLLTLITPLTPALSVTERPSSEAASDKAFHCCKVEKWSRLRDISFSGWSLKSWSSE